MVSLRRAWYTSDDLLKAQLTTYRVLSLVRAFSLGYPIMIIYLIYRGQWVRSTRKLQPWWIGLV